MLLCKSCNTRFEDGRLNILVEGGERFRLTELTDGRSFGTGIVVALITYFTIVQLIVV